MRESHLAKGVGIFLATAYNGAVEGGKGVYRATKEVGPPLGHDEPGPPVRSVGGPSLSFSSLLPSSSSHSNTIGDRVVKVQTMQSMSILHFPWTLPFCLSFLRASTAVLSTVQLVKGW